LDDLDLSPLALLTLRPKTFVRSSDALLCRPQLLLQFLELRLV
jgi:hypothetical protein